MIIISHRRNSILDLKETDNDLGVEIDIRSNGSYLIIQHDPFVCGESIENWLKFYNHKLLILNVKEEGLELELISLMKKYNIQNYFFLDQSFPFLLKYSKLCENRSAVRVSEFEHIQTALNLTGKIDWVWVDFFSKFPLTRTDIEKLKEAGFKLCIVSPELQGHSPKHSIPPLIDYFESLKFSPDAICTKFPHLWK